MSQSSTYFLRHAELRVAEEQQLPTHSERLNHAYYNRQLINEQHWLAVQDQEREKAYKAAIANSKGEKEYLLHNGI